MVGLEKVGVPQLVLALPRCPDRSGDKAEGAAGALEFRDVGEAFGKQADEFGMEGVAQPQLLFEIRLPSATPQMSSWARSICRA